MTAHGTPTDSIKFIRQYPTEACKHGGIRFYNSPSANNSLSYCWIDHAKNVNYPNSFGGGLFCDHIGVEIANSTISNCHGYVAGGGFYATDAPVMMSACVFIGNSSGNGGGLFLENCDASSAVKNCIFVRNSSTST